MTICSRRWRRNCTSGWMCLFLLRFWQRLGLRQRRLRDEARAFEAFGASVERIDGNGSTLGQWDVCADPRARRCRIKAGMAGWTLALPALLPLHFAVLCPLRGLWAVPAAVFVLS